MTSAYSQPSHLTCRRCRLQAVESRRKVKLPWPWLGLRTQPGVSPGPGLQPGQFYFHCWECCYTSVRDPGMQYPAVKAAIAWRRTKLDRWTMSEPLCKAQHSCSYLSTHPGGLIIHNRNIYEMVYVCLKLNTPPPWLPLVPYLDYELSD